MESELHLILLWEKARWVQDRISNDIKENFTIVSCYEIEWTHKLVSSNYTRFYGVNLPENSFKERECGRGKFLLFVVRDNGPRYEMRHTSHGDEIVNINLFDKKAVYRKWSRGGHLVHATNSVEETNHDLTLLLGINYDDYEKEYKGQIWDGDIISLHRDVSGAEGWQNLNEFFYIFNNTCHYVVMRGEENLGTEKTANHQDIDLLVREWQNAIYIMNGVQIYYSSPYRPKILMSTQSDGDFLFDLWMESLPYHCESWHKAMFDTKVFTGLYYKLNLENDFFSRLYHCLFHKNEVSKDYLPWFENKFDELDLGSIYDSGDYSFSVDMYYQALQDFMDEHGYEYSYVWEDGHCYHRKRIAEIKTWRTKLSDILELSNIFPYNVDHKTSSEYVYFKALYKNEIIFIKCGGVGNSCANEIKFSQLAYNNNNINFLKPILLSNSIDDHFFAYKFIKYETFDDYLTKSSTSQKRKIEQQMERICDTLVECNIIHRDIRPENFIVENGRLILIDFQFALDSCHPLELDFVKNHRWLTHQIGGEYRYKKYIWNDYYSFKKLAVDYKLCIDINSALSRSFYMPIRMIIISFIRHNIKKILNSVKQLYE